MKTRTDPRHFARIIALQKLFSQHFDLDSVTENYDLDKIAETTEINNYHKELANEIVKGVDSQQNEADEMINKYAPQWPIDQIQKVDLEILRIALWEGFLSETTPPKVAIDEAIEIAKEFGGDSSSKFINGVLGAIYEKQDSKQNTKNDKKK